MSSCGGGTAAAAVEVLSRFASDTSVWWGSSTRFFAVSSKVSVFIRIKRSMCWWSLGFMGF